MPGQFITLDSDMTPCVPPQPIIPFIEGDGSGPDIWAAASRVIDAAVERAYGGARRIIWRPLLAGERAFAATGDWLPEETIEAIKRHHVAIKGPLTTLVGRGIRNLNVALRQRLSLYANVRPIRFFPGVEAPVKAPQRLNVVLFRENTEDVYAGLEWAAGSEEAEQITALLSGLGVRLPPRCGLGLKPISEAASARLIRRAVRFALEHKHRSVTLVHKGNIMQHTEGAFRDWGYALIEAEFADVAVTEARLWEDFGGRTPEGKLLIKDRLTDAMFQQLLLRPDEYEVIATTNLNGDYLSDACAAQVGGQGFTPSANLSDEVALFEPTHGTAPEYAGQDKVNPSGVILSGEMMLRHMGWGEAADRILRGVEGAIARQTVTYDLARRLRGAALRSCSEFGDEIIASMK
ncbi:NADP-dependent isocitrate dehydrogenase [Myxococcota bacterium]|nr:NADP-dependent isocitrate dehydrogenase [Myxococcota bacterium]